MSMEEFSILPAKWGQVSKFEVYARKESVQMKDDDGKTSYLGIYRQHYILGFVGWMIVGKKVRYKADYVFHNVRGKGLYTQMWKARDEVVFKMMREKGIKEITAYCTKKSLPMYLKNGFKVDSPSRNGITFVTKLLLS